ncbi:MAG: sugar transferase [Turicibacter sanguinis]
MVLLSPLYLILSVIVLCDLGWPIIYKHRYPGLNEQLFTMYRFRTMTNETDERGHLLKPTQRLTHWSFEKI